MFTSCVGLFDLGLVCIFGVLGCVDGCGLLYLMLEFLHVNSVVVFFL